MLYIDGEKVLMKRFPNNEIYLDFTDPEAAPEKSGLFHKKHLLMGQTVWVGLRYESSDDIVGLGLLVDWLRSQMMNDINLSIPYLPYSTMDHIDKEQSRPLSLRFIAQFINSLKFRKVVVMEPHSAVSEAMIERLDCYDMTIELVEEAVRKENLSWMKVVAVFPDGGAQKRYEEQLNALKLGEDGEYKIPCLTFAKNRNFRDGKVFQSRCIDDMPVFTDDMACIIMDDLCRGGYTFEMAAKELKKNGCKKVILCVTHLEDVAFKPGKILNNPNSSVDAVYATDSCLVHLPDERIEIPKHLHLSRKATYPFI